MHTCFNVDEILRFIARELIESGLRRTAVALACCCRDFEDPVLDVLWETEYHLAHLLGTFPQGIWGLGEPRVSVAIVILFSFFTQLFDRESLLSGPLRQKSGLAYGSTHKE